MKNLFFISLLLYSNFLFSQIEVVDNVGSNSFMPESGKYVVSGWVNEQHQLQQTTFTSYLNIKITGVFPVYSVDFYTSGSIIDGWQRIIGVIEIPLITASDQPKLEINLYCNNNSGNECYFDDIRFYPYNGNMKSFVYDEDTQRLMAELDENNYATFYEYDLEGGLVRVKKETERGVFTIQETRSNNPKRN